MSIFAIGDLHLALTTNKSMNIFDGWKDYVNRLQKNWLDVVSAEDTVILMGDISWAMTLQEAQKDFDFIEKLPGKKIVLKGNHDYWWATMNKMNAWLEENHFSSISFLHNNSYSVENVSICGTRGWLFEPDQVHDAKVMAREAGRLKMSLEAATEEEKIVFLHYPPVFTNSVATEIIDILQDYKIEQCYYGHLHGNSIRWAIQKKIDGISYQLLSADSIDFSPKKIKSS